MKLLDRIVEDYAFRGKVMVGICWIFAISGAIVSTMLILAADHFPM